MTPAAEAMTGELAEMLSESVDPRTVPVRFSALKEIERSPLHYWHAVQDQREETLAMRLGSGAHALLFEKPYVLWTGKVRNGKTWDAFEAQHAGALILNRREEAEAKAMVASVRANPIAMRLLSKTTHEKTIHWTHNGRACRSTPDARSRLHVIEFKTCQSAEPGKFMKDAYWRRYHAQLAFYTDAITASGEGEPMEAYIIAVESSAPYAVSVLRLTDRALDNGRFLYRSWFARLLDCEAANVWPGYADEVLPFDVEAM